jgi:AAA domain
MIKEEIAKPTIVYQTYDEATLKSLPATEFVCEALQLAPGTLTALIARGGSGKSFLAQYLGLCVEMGIPFLDRYTVKKGSVLYVDKEMNPRLTLKRGARLVSGLGRLSEAPRLAFCYDFPRYSAGALSESLFEPIIEMFKPFKLVIIDSLRKISHANENDADQIEPIVDRLRIVAEKADTCIVLIHHAGKSPLKNKDIGRGSAAIYDSVDNQINCTMNGEDFQTATYTLSCAKARDGWFLPIHFTMRSFGKMLDNIKQTESYRFEVIS